MTTTFIITLFLTFIIVRTLAYLFHDKKHYGTKKENSKTLTGYLRKITKYDWHHFHFGVILCVLATTLLLVFKTNTMISIMLAAGISMILDQSVPIINRKSNYFHIKNLGIALLLHILVALIALRLY